MIQIKVVDEKYIDPATDELGRDRIGFKPGMSAAAMYDANHGSWVLGPRAERERFAVFVWNETVIQVVEIERIERLGDSTSDRSVIHGKILTEGHPVYDAYFGQPAPNPGVRNPVTYFTSKVKLDGLDPEQLCRCGCGAPSKGKEFLPGHDQTALHDRVRMIGTVAEFLDWFDALAAPLTSR